MNDTTTIENPNSDQIKFWNGDAARRWVEFNAVLERRLKYFSALVMDRANPASGDHVLDIGCGCGGTTMEFAQAVAPDGVVTGMDISEPMLTIASERVAGAAATVHIINGDGETYDLPKASYDLIVSRFGVMFFANPKTAFRNFLGALKPGGRLAFVCWRATEFNPWVTIPFKAALPLVDSYEPPKPDAPGQFGLARREWIETILIDAGFSDVRIDAHDSPMRMGEGDLDSCVSMVVGMGGMVARLMREADDDTASAIRQAVLSAVTPYYTGDCIEMAGSVWVVSANRPNRPNRP